MNELEEALIRDSYAVSPEHIIEGLSDELAHHVIAQAPRSIYAELWHICYWQEVSLDWIRGTQTPFPANMTLPFPGPEQTAAETWHQLCKRFRSCSAEAASHARDLTSLDDPILCTSRPGEPLRSMTIRDQLISLAAHNAYHFGRIVLMRQMLNTWPPPSGGFTW